MKNEKKGLGRGLDVFFGEDIEEVENVVKPKEKKVKELDKVVELNISEVEPMLNQPRKIFKKEKLQPCIENNIDVMIEDSPENIEYLSKQIKVIKFDCQYNKEVNNKNVITAYSWCHIYKIIKEMKGE